MLEKDYKNEIVEALRNAPDGLRLRDIGSHIQVWAPLLVQSMSELESEGKIFRTSYRDIGNMENYYIWKVSE